MGALHKSSNDMPQNIGNSRCSWKDHIKFIDKNLTKKEKAAKNELKKLKDWIESIDIRDNNFGLIHFDFELDNLIWDGEKYNIIDFDESVNHWYVADIAFALRDLFEDGVDLENKYFKNFIAGYKNEFELDNEILKDLR